MLAALIAIFLISETVPTMSEHFATVEEKKNVYLNGNQGTVDLLTAPQESQSLTKVTRKDVLFAQDVTEIHPALDKIYQSW